MADLIWVQANPAKVRANDRGGFPNVMNESHADHPNGLGQVDGPEPVQVARTSLVSSLIARQVLIEVKSPAEAVRVEPESRSQPEVERRERRG